jgi:citrate synthase
MTQLGMGVAALNHDSRFVKAYDQGAKKTHYWEPVLEDSLDLIAKLPALAARIYRNVYHPGREITLIDKDQDLVGVFIYFLIYILGR